MTSPQQRNRPGGKKNHEKKPSLEPAGRMARAADGLDRSCSGVPDRRRSSHTGKRYRPEPVRDSPGARRNALAAEVRVPVGEPAVRRLGPADADRFGENRAPRDGAASGRNPSPKASISTCTTGFRSSIPKFSGPSVSRTQTRINSSPSNSTASSARSGKSR